MSTPLCAAAGEGRRCSSLSRGHTSVQLVAADITTHFLAKVHIERLLDGTNVSPVSTAGRVGELSGHGSHRSDILPFRWPATHNFEQHRTCPCL